MPADQLTLEKEFYALQSYVPGNPKHRPRFEVVEAGVLKVFLGDLKSARTKKEKRWRMHWRILDGSPLGTQEEAEALADTWRRLAMLENPTLFAKKPMAPMVALPCGCRVSGDQRRQKRCPQAKKIAEAAIYTSFDQLFRGYRPLSQRGIGAMATMTEHLGSALKELAELERRQCG